MEIWEPKPPGTLWATLGLLRDSYTFSLPEKEHASHVPVLRKVKVKVALWGFSTLRPFGLLYSYTQQVPASISRGATHHTDARDPYQRRRELLPINFAGKSVIHENSLGSFTCRKAGTWDILFYFPSEGRHTEDFPDARKIQRLRPGLNPRTRVPVASSPSA